MSWFLLRCVFQLVNSSELYLKPKNITQPGWLIRTNSLHYDYFFLFSTRTIAVVTTPNLRTSLINRASTWGCGSLISWVGPRVINCHPDVVALLLALWRPANWSTSGGKIKPSSDQKCYKKYTYRKKAELNSMHASIIKVWMTAATVHLYPI